ncbi:hypothetical protein [Fibrobacter succinogenes]|uniref:hypothetical protein n=1 Tax=Fibrobacter succinogenes TaxID=833 RepID=UPI001566344B|nr:hypothetical protein [Fibrobacter succinogenes]
MNEELQKFRIEKNSWNAPKKMRTVRRDMKLMKKVFLCIVLAAFAFAAKPVPFEYNKVRILYVIDSFDDEKVEAVLPRSVIDSILQDVDSVYFAPFGACDCDCAGDDLYFYFSEKQKAPAKFHVAVGMPKICTGFTDNLDLVLRLKSTDKIKALADSLAKDYKPNPLNQKRNVDLVPFLK